MFLIYAFIFVIGAVLGSILRFRAFLRGTLLVGAAWVILAAFSGHGLTSFVLTFETAVVSVILLLSGAAIGRTLKQAFREG